MLTLISYVHLSKVTYTFTRPRYAFVIPKCSLILN